MAPRFEDYSTHIVGGAAKVKLKSLEEIATDLRAKGELDEKVLTTLKAKHKISVIASIVFSLVLMLDLLKPSSIFIDRVLAVLGLFLCYKICFPIINSLNKSKLVNLYTYGKVANGVITKIETSYYGRMLPSYSMEASYCIEEKLYQNKTLIKVPMEKVIYRNPKYVDSELQNLKQGSKIRIIYKKEEPDFSWIYTEKLNNIYNIRKKYMATAPAPVTQIA